MGCSREVLSYLSVGHACDTSIEMTRLAWSVQTAALQQALRKFGIVEIARTGKICLKRGPELLDEQPDDDSDDEDAVPSYNRNGVSTPLQQPDRYLLPQKPFWATNGV